MKRTVLGVIAAILLLVGLNAQPAAATWQGYQSWNPYYEYPGPWYEAPTCAHGFTVGTNPYGYPIVYSTNFGYGIGACSNGYDYYDETVGWWRFRVRLDYGPGGNAHAYSGWLQSGSPGQIGVDTYIAVAGLYQTTTYRACLEVQNYIWQYDMWSTQPPNGYCMYA